MKAYLLLASLLLAAVSAHSELLTITLDTTFSNRSETISINAQQTIQFKTAWAKHACAGPYGSQPSVVWNIHGLAFTNILLSDNYTSAVFVGPVTVYLASPDCENQIAATFDIQPSAFPPDKALTLGAFSGNVKVTMEQSTDLVNWTPAVNGMIYTNSPQACFFRIKMERNAQPPP